MRPDQLVRDTGSPVAGPVRGWGPKVGEGRPSPYLDDERWEALVNEALPAGTKRDPDAPRGHATAEGSPDGEAFERFCRVALRTARWRWLAAMLATVLLTAVAVGVLLAILSGGGRVALPGAGVATAVPALHQDVGGGSLPARNA